MSAHALLRLNPSLLGFVVCALVIRWDLSIVVLEQIRILRSLIALVALALAMKA